jgi:hypothetical protein
MSDALNDVLASYAGAGRPRRQRRWRRRWARRPDPTVAPAPVATV